MGDSKFVETLTYDEVQKHSTSDSLWCIVKVSRVLFRDGDAADQCERYRDKLMISLNSPLSILVGFCSAGS